MTLDQVARSRWAARLASGTMQSRPDDLHDAVVAVAVSDGWGLHATTAAYRPVGYGSHHWTLEDAAGHLWFASVNVLDEHNPGASFDHLVAALNAAAGARDSGLSFVVAPIRTPDGEVLRPLREKYALGLYPHVAGESGNFNDTLSSEDVAELTRLLCSLHDVSPDAASRTCVGVETFAFPGRASIEAALAALATTVCWPGPYGERLRLLLARHEDDVQDALREHDRLVATVGPQANAMVLTHGEPHPGNLIRTAAGMVLVDWDTALLAPPERDIWLLDARIGGRAAAEYTAQSGRALSRDLLARYDLAWSLADLAVFVDLLRKTPDTTADTAWSWDALRGTLEDLAQHGP